MVANVSAFESVGSDPLWVSAFVTVVLVIITGYYAWETRKMRLESVKPSFSLRTSIYSIAGDVFGLNLVNGGGIAKDIRIDVNEENGTKRLFYAPSISQKEEVYLEVIPEDVRQRMGYIEVLLSFKDGYGRNLKDSLKLDYKAISEENRKVAFRSTPLESNLKTIERRIDALDRSVRNLKRT